jgi:hypothetical protein
MAVFFVIVVIALWANLYILYCLSRECWKWRRKSRARVSPALDTVARDASVISIDEYRAVLNSRRWGHSA